MSRAAVVLALVALAGLGWGWVIFGRQILPAIRDPRFVFWREHHRCPGFRRVTTPPIITPQQVGFWCPHHGEGIYTS